MYFAVLTSTANSEAGVLALPPRKLREHPVIQNILETRKMWEEIRHHPRLDTATELADLERQAAKAERKARDPASVPAQQAVAAKLKKASTKKTKAERNAEAQQAASDARRAERMRKVEEELEGLSVLVAKKPGRKQSKVNVTPPDKLVINDDDSDLGDETVLTAQELAAKAARKKSLKFYTSQIAQKANKQGARSRDFGGDLDVPYRERLKDREARLNAAAERRGRQSLQPSEELGDESSGEEAVVNGKKDASDDDDYYDMVAARSKQKKADKKAAADAYAEAKRQNAQGYQVEEVGADGKRKISYAIERNKGLTPHRKKEVRSKFCYCVLLDEYARLMVYYRFKSQEEAQVCFKIEEAREHEAGIQGR
jgi:U3 small nucleolar RNA-associated protein 3